MCRSGARTQICNSSIGLLSGYINYTVKLDVIILEQNLIKRTILLHIFIELQIYYYYYYYYYYLLLSKDSVYVQSAGYRYSLNASHLPPTCNCSLIKILRAVV